MIVLCNWFGKVWDDSGVSGVGVGKLGKVFMGWGEGEARLEEV